MTRYSIDVDALVGRVRLACEPRYNILLTVIKVRDSALILARWWGLSHSLVKHVI